MRPICRYIPGCRRLGLTASSFITIVLLCFGADQGTALPEDYRIGAGDVLGILVWKEPDASVPEVVVRVDGKISMPLLGDVVAAGLTPPKLQESLIEQLSKYIHQPVV